MPTKENKKQKQNSVMLLALEISAHSKNDEYTPSALVEEQICHWAYTKIQMA